MQKAMKFNIDDFAKIKGISGQAARYHLRNYSKRTPVGSSYGWESQDAMRKDWAEIEKQKGAKVAASNRAKPGSSVKGRTRPVKASAPAKGKAPVKGKKTPPKTKPVAKKTAPAKASKKANKPKSKAPAKPSVGGGMKSPPLPADVNSGFGSQSNDADS